MGDDLPDGVPLLLVWTSQRDLGHVPGFDKARTEVAGGGHQERAGPAGDVGDLEIEDVLG